jgi:hypothetical protein
MMPGNNGCLLCPVNVLARELGGIRRIVVIDQGKTFSGSLPANTKAVSRLSSWDRVIRLKAEIRES